MRPEASSTRTIGRIYLQLFRGLLDPTVDADSLLDGPSSEVWIDPWVAYLDDLGVALRPGTPVRELHADRERVTGVTIGRDGDRERIEADYYVGAVPVETMCELRTPALETAAPSLSRLDGLDTAWMNGIQFYLAEDATDVHGHGGYLNAPWSLTSISQRQFWSEFDPDDYGDGRVEGILSICISDWDSPGVRYDRPARECTAEEIRDEVLAQLDDHLETGSLDETDLVDWFLDPAIEFGPDGVVDGNREPLLLNTVRSLRHRPDARTAADGFVLAADYVRTTTDLASMEGANEAARRATNAILADSGVDAEPYELFEFEEPAVFDAPKRRDELRYRLGREHPGEVGRTIALRANSLPLGSRRSRRGSALDEPPEVLGRDGPASGVTPVGERRDPRDARLLGLPKSLFERRLALGVVDRRPETVRIDPLAVGRLDVGGDPRQHVRIADVPLVLPERVEHSLVERRERVGILLPNEQRGLLGGLRIDALGDLDVHLDVVLLL